MPSSGSVCTVIVNFAEIIRSVNHPTFSLTIHDISFVLNVMPAVAGGSPQTCTFFLGDYKFHSL